MRWGGGGGGGAATGPIVTVAGPAELGSAPIHLHPSDPAHLQTNFNSVVDMTIAWST